jgi:methyl-accepting chemotaxis protein
MSQLAGSHQRRWKNLLVNRAYQTKYIFWVTASGGLLVLLNAATFYFFIRENYSVLVELSPMTQDAKDVLYAELRQVLMILTVVAFLFLGLVSILGLILSHRTAGPMYHFRRIFNSIEAGDHAARVRLRPNDDFKEVAHAFNAMMDKLQSGQKLRD